MKPKDNATFLELEGELCDFMWDNAHIIKANDNKIIDILGIDGNTIPAHIAGIMTDSLLGM